MTQPQSQPQPPLFYRNVVPLSRERHRGWYVDPDQGFSFAAGTNSVYIAASEFAVAAREYAIVFARDAGGVVVPAVLLGLRPDENLMIDDQGRWRARYVPAYVRRYPFILATPGGGESAPQLTVCIDEAYSGFNKAREGEQLIDDDGKQSELLSKSVAFLEEFHKHTAITRNFCQAMDEAGLLDSVQANVELGSGTKFSLSGMLCVTRDKLKTLPADKVTAFFETGYLELVYLHLHSLANVDRLLDYAGGRADQR